MILVTVETVCTAEYLNFTAGVGDLEWLLIQRFTEFAQDFSDWYQINGIVPTDRSSSTNTEEYF